MNSARVASMVAGDRFHYCDTTVLILRDAVDSVDRFGRTMLKFWATRDDTGAEGWIEFGPDATVELEGVA